MKMDCDKQASFRNAAAGLLKSMIRARARQEPDFLTAAPFEHWGVLGLGSETRSCAFLLKLVKRLREQFELRLVEGQESISVPAAEVELDDFDSLVEHVASFICGDLDAAIQDASKSKTVNWGQLANWESLAVIRDALDRLPKAPEKADADEWPAEVTHSLPIIRRNSKSATIEWQGTRHVVNHDTAHAFEAMIAKQGQPVGLGKFVRKPKQWLANLREERPKLAAIVARAEGNRGYRVTLFDPPSGGA